MLEETRKENQRLLRDMRGMETQMDELTRALHERERELNNLHLRLEQKDSEHRRMSTQVQETQLQTRKRSVEEDVAMLKLKREVADKSTRLQALQASAGEGWGFCLASPLPGVLVPSFWRLLQQQQSGHPHTLLFHSYLATGQV